MGAGEDILAELFFVLETCPLGSLIVVEEVEAGLHPQAVCKLAEVLQLVALKKKLQIVVSTHSAEFLDAVPRVARVLIKSVGGEHHVTHEPSTRFAMGEMTGVVRPEVYVYCEDRFAKDVIESCLPNAIRRRVKVIPVGSNAELSKQVRYHRTVNLGSKLAVVWDGEVEPSEAKQWCKTDRVYCEGAAAPDFSHAFLPGSCPPERWIVRELDCEEGHNALAKELNGGAFEAAEYIARLKAVAKHHDIVYELRTQAGLSSDTEARGCLIRAVKALTGDPLKAVRRVIIAELIGASAMRSEVASASSPL